MRSIRLVVLAAVCLMLPVIALMWPVLAQEEFPDYPDDDEDAIVEDFNRPLPITPGTPIFIRQPTLSPDSCFRPLPIVIGGTLFIKSGVNIRSVPDESGPLVWNTVVGNRDEDGNVSSDLTEVTVVGGPICSDGYNWWNITDFADAPGWVSEGRPDDDFGYWVIAPALIDEGCTPDFTFQIGEIARVLRNARIREIPNTDFRTVTVVPINTPIQIIGGPVCDGDFLWWFVRATVAGFTYQGWMREGDENLSYLVPFDLAPDTRSVCANPRTFFRGMRGYVAYPPGEAPKNLRTQPSRSAPILFTLVDGVPFVVLDGPVCNNDLNWWLVQVLTSNPVSGWITEGSPFTGYWLQELDPREFAAPGEFATPFFDASQ